MAEDEVSFIGAEGFSGGSSNKFEISPRQIILQQVIRVSKNMGVEMRGGTFEERPHPNININATITIYIPDTREVFSNSVDCLYDLLHAHFDKACKEETDKLIKELEDLYHDKTIIKEPDREDQKSNIEYSRNFENIKERISYRSQRVKINRRMFRALCDFLKRINYLEGSILEESM